MVARNFNDSEQVVRDAVSVTLELSELARPRFEGLTPYVDLNVGAYTVSSLADHIVDSNLYILILIVCDVVVVFLVFAVLLNAHLITAIMEMKRKQIGVLRALGGSERMVRALYLTGTAGNQVTHLTPSICSHIQPCSVRIFEIRAHLFEDNCMLT